MKKSLFSIMILMLAIVLSACGGDGKSSAGSKRDTSNVKKSLYGHWKHKTEDTHYYISDGKIITSSSDKKDKEDSYKVEEHDEVKNLIVIKQESQDGSGYVREITYKNDDRKELESLTEFSSMYFGKFGDSTPESQEFAEAFMDRVQEANAEKVVAEEWVYVDDKRKR